MSGKNRYVNTKFWDDSFIISLDAEEKLFFLYVLTNPLTNLSGIYEISLNRMSFDTKISLSDVTKILIKFEKYNKMKYENGWIAIKNFIAYQKVNPNVSKGIEDSLDVAPDVLKTWVKNNELVVSLSKPFKGYSDIGLDISKSKSKSLDQDKSKSNDVLDNKKQIISEIVEYLNLKLDTNYRNNTSGTRKHIEARLNEGFTLEDFKIVIDKKSAEWQHMDMQKFLRPETLFGNKFEGYLNQQDKPRLCETTKAAMRFAAKGNKND